MPFFHFIWTDESTEHIAEHDISQEDFKDVVTNPSSTDKSRSSGLPVAFGYTADGRYIIAVFEMLDDVTIVPVTAYEVDK